MRKIVLLLVGVFFLFSSSSLVYAHPPSDIQITFDPAKRILMAVITHKVSNTAKHYIDDVDVTLNEEKIIGQKISRQDNVDNQTVSYFVPDVKNGDVLSVKGDCNKGGELRKKITVKID